MEALTFQDIVNAIGEKHLESNQLYEALGTKITRKTEGDGFLGDDRVDTAKYWLNVAKLHRRILSIDFNLAGFEEAYLGFKFMVDYTKTNGSLTVYLKAARDKASKDCAAFCAVVRKRVKELEKDPVFALVLANESSPRAKAKPKEATTTPEKNA